MQIKPDRITFLIISFFILTCILFTLVLLKRNTLFSPFSNQSMGDYVVYQLDKRDYVCPNKQMCEQLTKVYRSGKALGLGEHMINDVYEKDKMLRVMSTIEQSKIMTKECSSSENTDKNHTYIIKYGIQVRRLEYPECKDEIAEIEQVLFGTP